VNPEKSCKSCPISYFKKGQKTSGHDYLGRRFSSVFTPSLMNHLLLLLAAWTVAAVAGAQGCLPPSAQIDASGNGVRARLMNFGDLFYEGDQARFQPAYAGPNTPSTIFRGSLWMGGIDPASGLKFNEAVYYPGPVDLDGGAPTAWCENWDRFFRVTDNEINAFLLDLADGTVDFQTPSIFSWPGRGNPFFSSYAGFSLPSSFGLAPFFDANADGNYNQLQWDYPAVKLRNLAPFVPSEIIWTVFNDQGGTQASLADRVGVEVGLTVFSFDCPQTPLVDNTLFTCHRIIYRGVEPLDSFHLGLFVDFDLGCYGDDQVGSAPGLHSFYAYNQSNTDAEDCSGVQGFGANPPAQAVTFLSNPLDVFMPVFSPGSPVPPGAIDPIGPYESFNYLTGSWRDGQPLTQGGLGYGTGQPVSLAFPDDPTTGSGWSMQAAGLPGLDLRGLGVQRHGVLSPGQILELTAAWSYHRGPGFDHLQNVGLLLGEVPALRALYESNFDLPCSLVSARLPEEQPTLEIAPNPAGGPVVVHWPGPDASELLVTDMAGRIVWQQMGLFGSEARFDASRWKPGVYAVRVRTENKVATGKLVVAK
jgi:hypothetical protein